MQAIIHVTLNCYNKPISFNNIWLLRLTSQQQIIYQYSFVPLCTIKEQFFNVSAFNVELNVEQFQNRPTDHKSHQVLNFFLTLHVCTKA